jgi:hypothetical protein
MRARDADRGDEASNASLSHRSAQCSAVSSSIRRILRPLKPHAPALRGASGFEVALEVLFQPLYRAQPTFWDIADHRRPLGYALQGDPRTATPCGQPRYTTVGRCRVRSPRTRHPPLVHAAHERSTDFLSHDAGRIGTPFPRRRATARVLAHQIRSRERGGSIMPCTSLMSVPPVAINAPIPN